MSTDYEPGDVSQQPAYQPDGPTVAIIVAVSIATAAVIAGSFGPWMTANGGAIYGMEGPEQFGLGGLIWGLGAGAAAWAGLARRSRRWLIAAVVAFGIVALGNNVDVKDIQEIATDPEFAAVRVGFGLAATIAGGVVGSVACVAAAIRNKPVA